MILLVTFLSVLASAAGAEDQPARSSTIEAVSRTPAAVEGLIRAESQSQGEAARLNGAPPANGHAGRLRSSQVGPDSVSDGFQVRPGLISHYVGGGDAAATVTASEVGFLYRDAGPKTDLVVQELVGDKVRHLLVLRDATAPVEHRFRLTSELGRIKLEGTDEGGVRVLLAETWIDPTVVDEEQVYRPPGEVTDDVELAYIKPPWAYDAAGNEIQTFYRIEGDTIVQEVHHAQAASYPVIADPTYVCGWVTCTIWFNRNETNLIASFGAGATAIVCAPFGGIAAAFCGVVGVYYQGTANYHFNRGGCLYLRYYRYWAPPPANLPWAGGHYGGRCN